MASVSCNLFVVGSMPISKNSWFSASYDSVISFPLQLTNGNTFTGTSTNIVLDPFYSIRYSGTHDSGRMIPTFDIFNEYLKGYVPANIIPVSNTSKEHYSSFFSYNGDITMATDINLKYLLQDDDVRNSDTLGTSIIPPDWGIHGVVPNLNCQSPYIWVGGEYSLCMLVYKMPVGVYDITGTYLALSAIMGKTQNIKKLYS